MTNQVSWRFPIGFQAFFAIASGDVMLFLPDTPRWYYAKGRNAEGDAILAKLLDKDIEHPEVQAIRHDIISTIELESEEQNKFNIWGLLWDHSDLRVGRRIRISFMLLSLQQMMGQSSLASGGAVY